MDRHRRSMCTQKRSPHTGSCSCGLPRHAWERDANCRVATVFSHESGAHEITTHNVRADYPEKSDTRQRVKEACGLVSPPEDQKQNETAADSPW